MPVAGKFREKTGYFNWSRIQSLNSLQVCHDLCRNPSKRLVYDSGVNERTLQYLLPSSEDSTKRPGYQPNWTYPSWRHNLHVTQHIKYTGILWSTFQQNRTHSSCQIKCIVKSNEDQTHFNRDLFESNFSVYLKSEGGTKSLALSPHSKCLQGIINITLRPAPGTGLCF